MMPEPQMSSSARTHPSGPLVSVVVPAYAAEEFIECTMRSVVAQTYRPMELIVVDDCSPDRTGEIAERVRREIAEPDFAVRIKHHAVNTGGAGALLTGFSLAAGDYICWLSADDAFVSPEKTSNQLAVMASGVGLVFDAASYIGPTPQTAERAHHRWASGRLSISDAVYLRRPAWILLSLCFGNPINGSSVMLRREVVREVGTFDPVLRNIDQDSDLWMRLCALGVRFRSADQAGVFYRIHPGQTSNLTSEVDLGCTLTRIRVLKALADRGWLGGLLDAAWPVLLLTRPGRYAFRSVVAQALCVLGRDSRCGVIPHFILSGLGGELRRRGYWDEDRLSDALREADASAQSEEFQRFIALLSQRGIK